MGSRAVVVERPGELELRETTQPVYDRPFAIRLLYEDPQSGAEHYVVRYPPGLAAQRHRHTAGHSIVVLEGALEVDGRRLGPGAYYHVPGGEPMHHAPAPGGGCLFLLLFDGPFDVEPLGG